MGRYIEQALKSVDGQSFRNWEVIAVDDCGPNDGTDAAVAAFAGRYPNNRIDLIRHDQNRGVSAARNTAIAAARGEFIAFLDPDDYWLPRHLENSLAEFRKQPETSVVSSMVRMIDEEKKTVEEYGPVEFDRNWFPASLAMRNFIQPSATVVRREILATVSGFDTTPQMQHVEDWDLWIKLAGQQFLFIFRPEADCVYRKHAGAATSNTTTMNDRISFLMSKHLSFFNNHMSSLIHELACRAEYSEFDTATKLALLNDKVDGPLMKAIRFIDRGLGRIGSIFGSSGKDE